MIMCNKTHSVGSKIVADVTQCHNYSRWRVQHPLYVLYSLSCFLPFLAPVTSFYMFALFPRFLFFLLLWNYINIHRAIFNATAEYIIIFSRNKLLIYSFIAFYVSVFPFSRFSLPRSRLLYPDPPWIKPHRSVDPSVTPLRIRCIRFRSVSSFICKI